ncbi:MAG: histidine triad nucleotide-binding protein [Chloroflexi bacterium]|nr:histidine triad nucleotide-binding protein [Chloroflexota bacterium]
MQDCIFCRIGRGEIPSDILFRDERCFVVRDIHPLAPTHLLIIPFLHITSLADIGPGQEPAFGHLLAVAGEMARREGVALSGYRLSINQGPDSGQGIPHVHLHLLGGKKLPELG